MTLVWKKWRRTALTLALSVLAGMKPARAGVPDEIYGLDNRQEGFEVTDPRQSRVIPSVAVLVDKKTLREENLGSFAMEPSPTFQEAFSLCDGERFSEQPAWGDCSSFLVGPDLLATAGHCVPDQKTCDNLAVVFDYAMTESGGVNALFTEVYSCKEILITEPKKEDYALIRLDRAAQGRKILPLRAEGEPEKDSPVFMVGFPSGLPLKVTSGAFLRSWDKANAYATLDTFGGNSGSPVINLVSGLVEGILVAALDDFEEVTDPVTKKKCKRVYQLPEESNSDLPTVSRASHLLPYLSPVKPSVNKLFPY